MDSGRLRLLVGDGRLGYPADAPYHAIHVGAAAATIPQPVSNTSAATPLCISGLYTH